MIEKKVAHASHQQDQRTKCGDYNEFFSFIRCRAAQKLNLSSSPHRRRRSGDENIGPEEHPIFPNGYAALLLKSPPPAPPALLRRIGVKELTGVGKVSFKIIEIFVLTYFYL